MLQIQKFTPQTKKKPEKTYVKCRVQKEVYENFSNLIASKGWSRDSAMTSALGMFCEAFGGKRKTG